MPLPFQTPLLRHRRTPASRRAGATPPPPPPPAGPRVLGVVFRPLESDIALYVFSEDVEDPQGDIGDLIVGGMGAVAWDRISNTELLVSFPGNVAPGMAWSNPEGGAGIANPDGEPLAAGAGVVG